MEAVRHVDQSAFRLRPSEYLKGTPDRAIRDELHSYLAEYRFSLSEWSYKLNYFDDHLRDTYTGESMVKKTAKAIELRRNNRKNTLREEAEYHGIQYLDIALQNALTGDHIIWASPPGDREDGYGNYGFVFSGTVDSNIDQHKHISMTAFRIEETSVDAYNEIVSTILGQQIQFNTPEEFLAQPFILHNAQVEQETILRMKTMSKRINNKQFGIAMGVLEPLVQQFIYEAKSGSSKIRLRQLFHAIENLAIELNENINFTNIQELSRSLHNNIEFIVQRFGMFKPPVVGGSCGSSGGDETLDTLLGRNIMNRLTGHILSKILGESEEKWDYHEGECNVCHKKPVMVGPCSICVDCEKRFS